jgi:SAM-dependent methyltransferase
VKDSDLAVGNINTDRIEGLFYSKADEKFIVRALLDDLFGNRTFERALDVGCGPGHISEPLARRTRQMFFVEKLPQYEDVLRKQFSHAKIVISDFREMQLAGKFDAIMFSHVLYYQPIDVWVDICKSLLDMLSDDGELFIIMNADAGDWWKIMQAFVPTLAEHVSFSYKPLSQLKRELNQIAKVQSFPYRFQVWIDSGATWTDFIGKQILEIRDDKVLREHAAEFAEFAKQFKHVDGTVVMDFRAELLRLRK